MVESRSRLNRREFGEAVDLIRVITPDGFQIWRAAPARSQGLALYESGEHTQNSSCRLLKTDCNANQQTTPRGVRKLGSRIANTTDYMHNVHCGALPILALKGFDPDNDTELGISVNTAIFPPTRCGDRVAIRFLQRAALFADVEEQINTLGVGTLKAKPHNSTAKSA